MSCLLSGQVGLEYQYTIDGVLAIHVVSEYCNGSSFMSGFIKKPGSRVEVDMLDASQSYLPSHFIGLKSRL